MPRGRRGGGAVWAHAGVWSVRVDGHGDQLYCCDSLVQGEQASTDVAVLALRMTALSLCFGSGAHRA